MLTGEAVVLGALAFASTNLDDMVLLALFFAQPRRQVARIVIGQYLGIAALVLVSVAAARAAVAVPMGWIPLLGLFPCGLGLKHLLGAPSSADEPRKVGGVGIFAVASVTAANGGDNLGVYIPLFASSREAIPAYIAIFAMGTAVWCGVGYVVASHRTVGALLATYGARVFPWVLIGIGLHILSALWS